MDPPAPFFMTFVVISGLLYSFMRRTGERTISNPLHREISARVRFAAKPTMPAFSGTGGFRGTRGVWISLRGPKRGWSSGLTHS